MTDSVPVIDIAELESSSALEAIDIACREWGFFQVKNHGIHTSITENLFEVAESFFAQTTEVKRKILRTKLNPWGFYDQELTKNTLDWKQVFDFGPADDDGLLPRWPDGMPGFEPAVRAYFDSCESLAFRLLEALANNLGVRADDLAKDFRDRHTSFLRLNFYPEYPADTPRESTGRPLGVNQHSDAGALTILLQDDQPGLEVFRDGEWHLVQPTEDALVINIGDMVQVWSNDRYQAALHRVITNTNEVRYSAPYFFNPAWETNYAPLPTTVDQANPPRYRPINWREFRNLRADGDYADYGDEVQIADYRIETG